MKYLMKFESAVQRECLYQSDDLDDILDKLPYLSSTNKFNL